MPQMDIEPRTKNNLISQEEYDALVEEIQGTITESVHNSRWTLIEGYWNVGRLIREKFTGHNLTSQLNTLGQSTGVGTTTLWNALRFFDTYPDINALPEGKAISWTKIVSKYLPAPPEEKKEAPPQLGDCSLEFLMTSGGRTAAVVQREAACKLLFMGGEYRLQRKVKGELFISKPLKELDANG